jgi:hypothetical protein
MARTCSVFLSTIQCIVLLCQPTSFIHSFIHSFFLSFSHCDCIDVRMTELLCSGHTGLFYMLYTYVSSNQLQPLLPSQHPHFPISNKPTTDPSNSHANTSQFATFIPNVTPCASTRTSRLTSAWIVGWGVRALMCGERRMVIAWNAFSRLSTTFGGITLSCVIEEGR